MLAAKICIEIPFRDFGTSRYIERTGIGIAVFDECLERGAENALLHKGFGRGPIGGHGFFHVPKELSCYGTHSYPYLRYGSVPVTCTDSHECPGLSLHEHRNS